MARRRLRVVCSSSSDEENEQHQQQQPQQVQQQQHEDEVFDDVAEEEIEIPSQDPIPNIETVTLNSSIPTISVDISDEEFIDVSDNLSPPSPPPRPPPPEDTAAQPAVSASEAAGSFVISGCPVNDYLRKLGLSLRREWLDSCKLGLGNSVPGFSGFNVETKAKLCFGQFLYSDMNFVGAGVLPENVHELHMVDLAGPFVLQVDEVINISSPLRERYNNAPAGLKRCLKFSMTDGVQRVFGMEYRPLPIKALEALGPAGFKVVIRNVNVRRGLVMLVPEVLEVLGGSVEEFEAARQRLVHEINKPPRGTRSRTGLVPPLSTRATLAAWPQNGSSNGSVPSNGANRMQGNSMTSTFRAPHQFHENVHDANSIGTTTRAHPNDLETSELSIMGETFQSPTSIESALHPSSRESGQQPSIRESSDQHPTSRESAQPPSCGETGQLSTSAEAAECRTSREATEPPTSGACMEPHSFSTTVIQNEDALMVDYAEHPFILSGGKELPFTYLASLSAKWAAMQEKEPFIQGKIKCFVTGVKGFQYRQRTTFELRVYVDDGSLISEILIHHNVVQKGIGYSPEEVAAALSSSNIDIVSDMKDTLKEFQVFLINFEGTLLVEMNETSSVPVALEMSQGCPTSDAWSLVKRLKPVSSANNPSDVINLSP